MIIKYEGPTRLDHAIHQVLAILEKDQQLLTVRPLSQVQLRLGHYMDALPLLLGALHGLLRLVILYTSRCVPSHLSDQSFVLFGLTRFGMKFE